MTNSLKSDSSACERGAAARATTERCGASVYSTGSFSGHRCGNVAKHQHEGHWYCGIHNPMRLLAKREETNRKYAEQRAAANVLQQAERDAQAALERDAARYRWMRDVAWANGMADVMCSRYGPEEWDAHIDAEIARAAAPLSRSA